MRRKTTLNQDLEICALYRAGQIQQDIADRYNIDRTTVVGILKRNNVVTRRAGSWAKKYEIDESLFEKIDCEWKSYFLGFMYADGNMQKYEVVLQLSEKDKEILDVFNKIIFDSKRPLGYHKGRYGMAFGRRIYTKPSYRFRIINKKIAQDLRLFGLKPRKSLTLEMPNQEQVPGELMRHFIRGYFDGDGSVTIKPRNNRTHLRHAFSINSSRMFCAQLKDFFLQTQDIKCYISRDRRKKIDKLVTTSKEQMLKLYNYFYSNATIFLKRKKNIFQNVTKDSHDVFQDYVVA